MSSSWLFDETEYLRYNLDVANAGIDAYTHFLQWGLAEGRTPGYRSYSESLYLERYSDVAAAVARGDFASGWEHYNIWGFSEIRYAHTSIYVQGANADDTFSVGSIGAYQSYLPISSVVRGYEGNDSLAGGNGNDIIYGNSEADYVEGKYGDDTLYGGQNDGPADSGGVQREGVDTLYGGSGNDLIYGNHGADILVGGNGLDTIYGGQDNDTIYGGGQSPAYSTDPSLQDVLFGNRGDDVFCLSTRFELDTVIYGGPGADTIEIARHTYQYTIDWRDFDPNEGDRLDVSQFYINGESAMIITQEDGASEVSFVYPSSYGGTRFTIDFNRTDFSTEWLIL